MTKERIKQITENVNNRNLINAICGAISPADNEILELLDYIKKLEKKVKKAIKAMEITKDIIKKQPSNNPNEDKFIIDNLDLYIKLLKGVSYENS